VDTTNKHVEEVIDNIDEIVSGEQNKTEPEKTEENEIKEYGLWQLEIPKIRINSRNF
jgi:broad-specificity NMP kinase